MSETKELLRRGVGDFEPTPDAFERVLVRRDRKRRNQRVAAGLLGIAVIALVAVGFARLLGSEGTPASQPQSPFEGTWISTSDADDGTQTMTVSVSAEGVVEVTVLDDIATVCGGTPSTMTGTGRIEDGTALVIPAPVFTCDDGRQAETLTGSPLAEQLRDWTLVLDPQNDWLTDGFGGVWLREGAEDTSPAPTATGQMWPQSSLEEVRQAQELADAGDPDYTWQLAPKILGGDPVNAEIIDRFIHEELGWEEYRFNPFVGWETAETDLNFVRCAPGETNPLYPQDERAGQCAPTLDEFRYETVSIDLVQPVRTEPTGIWVVTRWATATPFAQADPAVVEAQSTTRLENFLQARVEGEGAEGFVELGDSVEEIPLLYGTTAGAPYERSEIERVSPPMWPYGSMEFVVRLFADGGQTVVEQPISLRDDGTLYLDAAETTEDGQPLGVTYSFFDGEVTFVAADPWRTFGGCCSGDGAWGALSTGEFWSSKEGIELVTCAPGPASQDAQALAESIRPDQVATAPAAVRVGGAEGLVMDVTIPAGSAGESSFQPSGFFVCGASFPSAEVVTRATLDRGIRMRLYLLDLPEGSATRNVVIAISAPQARFDAVTRAAAPIIDSVEFHTP